MFASLPTFTHSTFFSLEELHLIGQGVAKHVHELITVSLNVRGNSAIGLKYSPTDEEVAERGLVSAECWPFTFDIPKARLFELGKLIEVSRATIPTTFDSNWENPIENSGGIRGVDWIDFLLYMIPTVFVPALTNNSAKKPLLLLSKACALALKWTITQDELLAIKE